MLIAKGVYIPGNTYSLLAHGLKNGNEEAVAAAARIFKEIIPKDITVAPMPSHTGEPTYMAEVARLMEKDGYEVEDIFRMMSRETLYKAKKEGRRLETEIKTLIKPQKKIIVIDNVIATALTAREAIRAGAWAVAAPAMTGMTDRTAYPTAVIWKRL